jgi:hypothetical protein
VLFTFLRSAIRFRSALSVLLERFRDLEGDADFDLDTDTDADLDFDFDLEGDLGLSSGRSVGVPRTYSVCR